MSVNIVGAGIAGLSAAITLAKQNIQCDLISLQPSERAQSVLAEGGMNAALDTMGEGDTTGEHFADTMRGGADLADPNAVSALTSHAPEIVTWLSELGVPFQRSGDKLILRHFGGQKKRRTAYAQSSTGKAIMTALIDEARKYEAAGLIHRFSHHEFFDLVLEDRKCVGITVRDTYTNELFRCPGETIIACGGLNGFFPGMTTGTTQNSGDVAALLFRRGVAFANLEFIQYHPTTVQIADKRLLISEAARGEGGRLFVLRGGEPWYFMEERYPELGNLMPRDVVTREMVRVCGMEECGNQAFLDLTGLSKETWEKKLPDLREELLHYLHLDPAKTPVPVSPGIHFFMGGIAVDEEHRTNIPGLYAAGECASQYHGANRLGGNSMLGAAYGGMTAAKGISRTEQRNAQPACLGKLSEDMERERYVSPACTKRLAEILHRGLGIVRSGETISAALEDLERLLSRENLTPMERRRILLTKAMLESALRRKESRGAHYRTDFPLRDDEGYQKTSVAIWKEGGVQLTLRPIPERRGV